MLGRNFFILADQPELLIIFRSSWSTKDKSLVDQSDGHLAFTSNSGSIFTCQKSLVSTPIHAKVVAQLKLSVSSFIKVVTLEILTRSVVMIFGRSTGRS